MFSSEEMKRALDMFHSLVNGQKRRDNTSQIGELNMECDENYPDNGLVLKSCFMPEEVLIRILSFVDPHSLVRFRFVCKIWRDIIEYSEVWKLMILRSNVASLSNCTASERKKLTSNYPWYLNYWISVDTPFEKNLLRNNCGQGKCFQPVFFHYGISDYHLMQLFFPEILKFWTVTSPYGTLGEKHWNVQRELMFTSYLPESDDFGANTCCFSTSFVKCRKHQEIDLSKEGFSGRIHILFKVFNFTEELQN